MSELNQAPQSVEAPSEEFFRSGTTTEATTPSTDGESSKSGPAGNGAAPSAADAPRAASLVSAAKAALTSNKSKSTNGTKPDSQPPSNGAKVSVAPNVSGALGANPKATNPNPANPNVSALAAPPPKPNPNTAALGADSDRTQAKSGSGSKATGNSASDRSSSKATESSSANQNKGGGDQNQRGSTPQQAPSAAGGGPTNNVSATLQDQRPHHQTQPTTNQPTSNQPTSNQPAGNQNQPPSYQNVPGALNQGSSHHGAGNHGPANHGPANYAQQQSGRPPSAPMIGQVSGSGVAAEPGSLVASAAPRPPAVPYPTRNTGLTGQVRRTISGAGVAAGAVVSGSVDAVRVAAGAQSTEPGLSGQSARRTRKARLRLSRVDPWSVMKTSFLFAIAGGIILFVSVWVVWGVINASGAFDSINTAVNDLIANPGAETKFTLESYVNTQRVLGFTALIAAADVVIFTALATLMSFLYNLAATVLGGLEVTLAED